MIRTKEGYSIPSICHGAGIGVQHNRWAEWMEETKEDGLWVKVGFLWRERKPLAAHGWALHKQRPSPK